MSNTDRELQGLRKEVERLTSALAEAQALNAGLERDKDNAFKVLQLVLRQLPGHRAVVSESEWRAFRPHRWQVTRVEDLSTRRVVYQLEELV